LFAAVADLRPCPGARRRISLKDVIHLVLGAAGVALIAAAVIMIFNGWSGRRAVMSELTRQRISFPGKGLPDELASYTGRSVRTGVDARAYSDLIARHVAAATGGRTYSEIADEWLAGGRTDDRLARLRETAFMGQSLRGALLGAYQAWQITVLVIGLGALCATIGVAFLALAFE
jgi:hypothetical protein